MVHFNSHARPPAGQDYPNVCAVSRVCVRLLLFERAVFLIVRCVFFPSFCLPLNLRVLNRINTVIGIGACKGTRVISAYFLLQELFVALWSESNPILRFEATIFAFPGTFPILLST